MDVLFEAHGAIALITLNRPEARNAISPGVAEGIEHALDQLEGDPALCVGILRATITPERPVFCAGADLKAINSTGGAGIHRKRGGFGGIAFRDRTKPLIAAVDGLATAGGCEIALACDIIVASTRSSFGLAEVKRNLVANAGGLYRLPRALGQSTAMMMALTGEPISAARAYQLGLVAELVAPDEVDATAMRIGEQIARNGPLSVRETRAVVAAAFDEDDAALRERGYLASRRMYETEDTKEGVRAFVEKREPRWQAK